MILFSSFPARPTKARPVYPRQMPGASQNTSLALALPTPNTVLLRVDANSTQALQSATS